MYRPTFSSMKRQNFKFNFQSSEIFKRCSCVRSDNDELTFGYLNEGRRGWRRGSAVRVRQSFDWHFYCLLWPSYNFHPLESLSYLNILCSFIWFMRLNSVVISALRCVIRYGFLLCLICCLFCTQCSWIMTKIEKTRFHLGVNLHRTRCEQPKWKKKLSREKKTKKNLLPRVNITDLVVTMRMGENENCETAQLATIATHKTHHMSDEKWWKNMVI